jgi:hypothetical protein
MGAPVSDALRIALDGPMERRAPESEGAMAAIKSSEEAFTLLKAMVMLTTHFKLLSVGDNILAERR